jgi:hypothetical protein
MNVLPLLRFLDDSAGTQWAVLFAGPLTRRMLPGLQRHIVFRAEGQQLIAEHDWINQPLSDPELRGLLEQLRSSTS